MKRSVGPVRAGVVRGACHHDCPDTCVWEVTVEDGRAVALRGLPDHPTTKGQLCPKVNRFLDRVHHPDRILTPLGRTGPKGSGEFTPITWDDAIAEIGKRFRSIIAHSGPAAILPYSFDGTQGVIQKGILARRFFCRIVGRVIGQYGLHQGRYMIAVRGRYGQRFAESLENEFQNQKASGQALPV